MSGLWQSKKDTGPQVLNDGYEKKRVVGYFTAWGTRNFTSQQAQKLTHAIFAFLKLHPDGSIGLDSYKETLTVCHVAERLAQFLQLARQHAHLKTQFAVGGWDNSEHFSSIAADKEKRWTMVESIMRIVHDYGFDGVDLDWEYPVTGGANEGVEADKQNYVILMKQLRKRFDDYETTNKHPHLLISFAGAAGQWTLDPGFDLAGLLQHVDYVNIMTYDYFGAWPTSKWGAYTGPPAPLYFGTPKSYSGKTHVHWTMKYYYCKGGGEHLKKRSNYEELKLYAAYAIRKMEAVKSMGQNMSIRLLRLNLGLPFYSRYWKNVNEATDPSDSMWRLASPNSKGEFEGGHVAWNEMEENGWDVGKAIFHTKSRSAYIWNPTNKTFLGMENVETLKHKLDYFNEYSLGGLMIWTIDFDDSQDTLLNIIAEGVKPENSLGKAHSQYNCPPVSERRWWTFEDGEHLAGKCGKSAPLFKGYYPVCDPDDPGYACCGPYGYCGSGPEFCDCPTCVNYALEPWKIVEELIRPKGAVKQWYTEADGEGLRGRCGGSVPKINGLEAICDPESTDSYCCSSAGYCGNTPQHCQCSSCINYKNSANTSTISPGFSTTTFKLIEMTTKKAVEIEWWTYAMAPENIGRCGPTAPRLPNGKMPKCNYNSENAYCCSRSGYCGSTEAYCACQGCVDFKSNPGYLYVL
uniref:GH18 domain-containing protein n=1 Tax=Ditylenchus dipsaci TaxID=166011 RepID=A0A915ETH3_9BILA